jgi:Curli production assembly/transport component CsgG
MSIHCIGKEGCVALAMCLACSAAPAASQGVTAPKQGKGGSMVQGAAGTGGAVGAKGLQHCDKPMGAVAVVEPQDYVMRALSGYGLQSPVGLIRMMIQQSNCFIVVERGIGMQNMMQERALADSGQLRQSSNVGGGQMVAADFILTPSVVFSEGDAGGVGGAVGGFFRRASPVVGAVAGGLKFKEAQTSMLLADARSGVQVSAAEGSTRKADLNVGGALFGGGGGAALGGYGNTNEGKIIAAALLDNYNNVVNVVRNDESLQRNVGNLKDEAAAGGKTKTSAVFGEGDVLVPKIANVKLLATPADDAKVLATLARTDEVVVVGEEKNGYISVQGASASGWVKIVLMLRP